MKNKYIKKILTTLVFVCVSVISVAQMSPNYEHEIGLDINTNLLMSDLGSNNITFNNAKLGASLKYRYIVDGYLSIPVRLSYNRTYSSDKYATDMGLYNRNEHVYCDIISLEVNTRLNLLYDNSIYRNKRTHKIIPHLTMGIGLMYFNPFIKGSDYGVTQNRVYVRKENLESTSDIYNNISGMINFGCGMSYNIKRKLTISTDIRSVSTYTDYLDNTSTSYGNPEIMSDIGKQIYNNQITPNNDVVGSKKGNSKKNDMYFTISIGINYKI